LEHLQAEGAMPAVESDTRSWQRLFINMIEAEDLAKDTTDEDKPYYKREVEVLSDTWSHVERGTYSLDAPQSQERELRGESEERLASVDCSSKRKRGRGERGGQEGRGTQGRRRRG